MTPAVGSALAQHITIQHRHDEPLCGGAKPPLVTSVVGALPPSGRTWQPVSVPSPPYVAALARIEAILELAAGVYADSDRLSPAERRRMVRWIDENRALAQGPPHALAGLVQLEREILTEWREGAGADVGRFWQRVAEAGLDVPRKRDVVAETLARGRVRNMDEFVTLDDAYEELQACGKVDDDEAQHLDAMLRAFESDPAHQQYFEDEA